MNKTNGYSFAHNEAPKAKSDEAASLAKDNEAPIINKIVGSFVIIVLVNSIIWMPVFIVDSLIGQLVAGFLSAIVSIVVSYFIIQYLKKHWHDLVVPEGKSHYNSSTTHKRYESAATSLKYSNVRGNVYNRTMR